jgi:hypothetical protein
VTHSVSHTTRQNLRSSRPCTVPGRYQTLSESQVNTETYGTTRSWLPTATSAQEYKRKPAKNKESWGGHIPAELMLPLLIPYMVSGGPRGSRFLSGKILPGGISLGRRAVARLYRATV